MNNSRQPLPGIYSRTLAIISGLVALLMMISIPVVAQAQTDLVRAVATTQDIENFGQPGDTLELSFSADLDPGQNLTDDPETEFGANTGFDCSFAPLECSVSGHRFTWTVVSPFSTARDFSNDAVVSVANIYDELEAPAIVSAPVSILHSGIRWVESTGSDTANDCIDSGNPCATIQHAIGQAEIGDTVRLLGNVDEGLVNITKAVTLDGAGFTLNSESSTHGIRVSSDDVAIMALTVDGAGSFGIHQSPGHSNLTIAATTVQNGGATGFAMNCSDEILLEDISAFNNLGNGVSITNCTNVVIDGMTSSGNAFAGGFSAGIGIFSDENTCTPDGTSGVEITGNLNIAEPVTVYEQATTGTIENVSVPEGMGSHVVGFGPDVIFYYGSLEDALNAAEGAVTNDPSVKPVMYVRDLETGTLHVRDFMSIQAALNAASSGDVVDVAAGDDYLETIVVGTSDITLVGDPSGVDRPVLTWTDPLPVGEETLIRVAAENVIIDGFALIVDQSHVGEGIRTIDDSSGMIVRNNRIVADPSDPESIVPFGIRNAIAIDPLYRSGALQTGFGPIVIENNLIEAEPSGVGIGGFFRAGVAMDTSSGTIVGNDILTWSHDIIARFTLGGNLQVQGNTVRGGGVQLSEYNATGPVSVAGNIFLPDPGLVAILDQGLSSLRLQNNHNQIATLVEDNLFDGHATAVRAENHPALTILDNVFQPTDATDFRHIIVSNRVNASNFIAPLEIDVTIAGNDFEGGTGQGVAIVFDNHNCCDVPGSGTTTATFGELIVGGSVANDFSDDLEMFIVLDDTVGLVSPIGAETEAQAFFANVDARGNIWAGVAGADQDETQRAATRAKIQDQDDNAQLGEVILEILAVPIAQSRIHEGSTTVTRTLFSAPGDGQGLMMLNYVLDENGLITGQAADDLSAQSPGTGAVPGFGFGEALAERPDTSVTHFVSEGFLNSTEWNTSGEVVTSAGNTGARWYLYVAREVNADGDPEVDGGFWIPMSEHGYSFTIYWYAGDPDNGGVLVGAETLAIDVIDSSVQLQLIAQPRIHEGSTTVTDTVFGAPTDGQGEMSLEYLLDENGLITGQAADDLSAQSPGAGAVPGFGFGEALAERPDTSVTHFVSEGFLNSTEWNTSGEVVTSAGNTGARWYLYVAREVNADGDPEVDGGFWIPMSEHGYSFTIYWYAGDPQAGGLIVGAETLAIDVIDNSQFQDQLAVALAGFESEYARGDMESGSEQVQFVYTANAGDIEQVFNVFTVLEGGVEIAPEDYDAIFESVSFDPNQIRGLSGTDAEVVTAPGDLATVSVFFTLEQDAPLGDYEIVITSYDVTGIDPEDVSLGDVDSYRVLDSASQMVSLIEGAVLELSIEGPAIVGLTDEAFYDVRLQNTGDADVTENVAVHFTISRPDIDLADVVVDWCADQAATSGETCADWQPLPLQIDNGSLSGQFGPSGGFPVDVDYDETTFIRASFTEPGNYDAAVDALGATSEEVLASTGMTVSVTELAFEIADGVQAGVPDSEAGWAYFTATLANLGDELPENILLWVAIDGIDQSAFDDGASLQYFDPDDELWRDFGWGDHPDLIDPREAFFLGRDGAGNVAGFPIGDQEVFDTPIRVNFDNDVYDFTTSVESLDAETVYGLFEDQVGVISDALNLTLDIERGVTAPDQPPRWDYFTATLSNTGGGATPDNIVLYVEVDATDFAAGDALEFWNGSEWQSFGWDADREAWFLGRDGAGGVSGFPIDADEVFPIEVRVNFLPDFYEATVSVESIDDTIVGVGGIYAVFVEQVDVLPTPATVTFDPADLVQVYDGNVKTVSVTTAPEAGLAVEVTFDPDPPIDAGTYSVTAVIVDPYFEGDETDALLIEPAEAVVLIDDLLHTYDGDPKPVTVTTDPTGLDVAVTYDGLADAPTDVGDYLVEAVVIDSNYSGEASDTLVIEAAEALVTLDDLVQVYDGDPKPVTVTTDPAGLNVVVTYDGSADVPVDAGDYVVEAVIDDPNYTGEASDILTIEQAAVTIEIADLMQVYDGSPLSPTITTVPADVSLSVTYDGSPDEPVNAGSYLVVAAVADLNYEPVSESAVFVIQKGQAEINLSDLTQVYDGGNPLPVTVETVPAGLDVVITYDGSSVAPGDVGTYSVVATVDDANWTGSESGLLVIEPAEAVIMINDLVHVYDGDPKPVTVTTDPAGLNVSVTYDGSGTVPVNAGDYLVVAVIDEANYVGDADATLMIEPAEAVVMIDDLVQDYDGDPKPVTVTTDPAGLNVIVTYDGSAEAPIDVGSYLVEATIDEPNYVGSEEVTLMIEQGAQTIDFPALPNRTVDDSPFSINATATSGLVVEFIVLSGPATIDGNEVTLTGELGEVVIEANQAGDGNWLAADPVQQSFQVTEGDGNTIEAVSDTTINGQAGEPVAAEDLPTVRVLDAHENPVSGITVSFEVTSGGGSVNGATQVTDVDGIAQVGGWTLGSESVQTMTASAPGLTGSPVEFTAEVEAVVNVQISIDDNRETIEPGERNTYVIVASNEGPNEAENATVTVALPPQLDADTADWICLAGAGASCNASGTGGIEDSEVVLPAGASVIYLLEADVRSDASGIIEIAAEIVLDDFSAADSATTQIVITEDQIFRDRFEDSSKPVALGGGMSRVEGYLNVSSSYRGGLPPGHMLVGQDASGSEVFRIRVLEFDWLTMVRIEMRNRSGRWVRADWAAMQPSTEGVLAFEYDSGLGLLLLVGTSGESVLETGSGGQLIHQLVVDEPGRIEVVIHD